MVILPFTFARVPHLYFGAGKFSELSSIIAKMGQKVLIVTGASSFRKTERWEILKENLRKKSITYFDISVLGEPSPQLVDNTVTKFKKENIEVVVSIGGGSVIDTGKAVSAMLLQENSIFDYLEDIGKGIPHNGKKIPFVAVPTTAGTGSEATKNAVFSCIGPKGFKKSIRHDNFIPDVTLIDPELSLSCPKNVTASCGMDAFSQLLESYISTKSNPLTDALALSGIEFLKDSLIPAFTEGERNLEARANMCYAAFLSGVTLANAGLGLVHGLASVIGGYYPIPHGVICGAFIGPVTRYHIMKLKRSGNILHPLLEKYAKVALLLSGKRDLSVESLCQYLIDRIESWAKELQIPSLNKLGLKKEDIDKIVVNSENKNSPLPLTKEEIYEMIIESGLV